MESKVKRQIVLTEGFNGKWLLSEYSHPGTHWPTVEKPDGRSMVARLLQLLDLGPVAPQTEPESVVMILDEIPEYTDYDDKH